MADQTVVSAASIIQAWFEQLTSSGVSALDLIKQGEIYYVEGNAGLDTNDGLSWGTAFKTLAYAMARSHANISAVGSKGWAARNTIYCKGDYLDEDLTKLAQKTDIVGVGSCDDQPRCRLVGTHVIPTPGVVYVGCRFFNMDFRDDGASSNWTITNQSGIEFHNCRFERQSSGTYGITANGCPRMKFINCEFLPDAQGGLFTTAAIKLDGAIRPHIINCIIYGVIGIYITTAAGTVNPLIKNNTIYTTGKTIDDDSNLAIIVGNRLISAANKDTLGNVLDYNAKLGCDNILTGNDGTIHCPAETA